MAGRGRVVVKVGSSSLTSAGGGLDPTRLDALVDALAAARSGGWELLLVTSGAIASGLAPLRLRTRPRDLATAQAAASVGQGLLVRRYTESFARHGLVVGQVLLTAEDVVRRAHYRNAQRTLYRLLEMGAVPVINENDTVATHEIRFGDNDRLAALVAHLVHADTLLLLSDVDGIYDGDPRRGHATLIREVRTEADLAGVKLGRTGGSGLGTGGMASKVAAARIAAAAGIPAVITAAGAVGAVLAGHTSGTTFHPAPRRMPTRHLWLAYAAEGRGRLLLDAGAVDAVVRRRASLLAAGVVGVDGDFRAGDPVDLCDENGHVVARGLVNFDVSELPGLLGRSTPDLVAEYGPAFRREVVHRDDLVLVAGGPRHTSYGG